MVSIAVPPFQSKASARGGGTLLIKVVRGEFIRNTEIMGQMDPFVKLVYRGKAMRTKVVKDGG